MDYDPLNRAYGPNRERVRQKVVTSTPAVNKTIYYIEDFFEVEAENNVPPTSPRF